MNKFWKSAVLLAGAVVMLAGCGESGEDGELSLRDVQTAYGSVSDAATIEQSIEIRQGSLVQYTETKKYTLTEGAYTVSEETQRLNPLTEAEAYSLETKSYTVSKSEAFAASLAIEDSYLVEISVAEDTLTAKIKPGEEKNFLALGTLTAVSDMTVSFTMENKQLDTIRIGYVSGASAVTIAVHFAY